MRSRSGRWTMRVRLRRNAGRRLRLSTRMLAVAALAGFLIVDSASAGPRRASATDVAVSIGDFSPGSAFSFTFNKVGNYTYYCEIHPFMHGEVKVRAG